MYWAYRPEREVRRKSRLIKSPAARRIGNSTNPAPKASGLTNLDEKRGYRKPEALLQRPITQRIIKARLFGVGF